MSAPAGRDAVDVLSAYDYELPREHIAQSPLAERDGARLLVLPRAEATPLRHAHVRDLPSLLAPGDLLVVNATRVLPARLRGRRTTGGAAEALILGPESEPTSPDAEPPSRTGGRFRALVKISGRLRPGIELCFEAPEGVRADAVTARIVRVCGGGEVTLAFEPGRSPYAVGRAPLPPYIARSEAGSSASRAREDLERYQTVFARVPGAIAAPTAGLHLTRELLAELGRSDVGYAEIVLHVGAGTFRPLQAEQLASGVLHPEHYELPDATAAAIEETRRRGGRVVAVGTTVARVLEACAAGGGRVRPGTGETRLFLRPGSRFRVIDALLTNFHLPRSSLLLLVAAFAGRERVLSAYRVAVEAGYRFYSYGDTMLIR